MTDTDRAEVRQAVLDRLLSQSAVAYYASTWRLSVEEARVALSSRVEETYLMTPRGQVWLSGDKVLVDFMSLGRSVEILDLAEFESLLGNHALGEDTVNLAVRHYLGHKLGWRRHTDEEVLPSGEVSRLDYLVHRGLGWTVGWSRPVTGSFLPAWDSSPLSLAYLVRWLHVVGVLSSPVVESKLILPYWHVVIDGKLYKVSIGEWVLTPHQAATHALGQHLANLDAASLQVSDVSMFVPPVLHDESGYDGLADLCADWEFNLLSCSCGRKRGSQLDCCTHLGPDKPVTATALEYFYRQRDDIETREKHDQPTRNQAGR